MPRLAALWDETDDCALTGAIETASPCAMFCSSPHLMRSNLSQVYHPTTRGTTEDTVGQERTRLSKFGTLGRTDFLMMFNIHC